MKSVKQMHKLNIFYSIRHHDLEEKEHLLITDLTLISSISREIKNKLQIHLQHVNMSYMV